MVRVYAQRMVQTDVLWHLAVHCSVVALEVGGVGAVRISIGMSRQAQDFYIHGCAAHQVGQHGCMQSGALLVDR